MLNEVDIDFRTLGLPHSVVKQAENYRVRELVKKIENHPHRQSLQQDLQQNKAYNPFSTTSKKLIQDMGNVELFELFETNSKTQCKACLSCWSEGIVFCTCGHLFKEPVANRRFVTCTMDFFSIPEYVRKKGRLHGHRYEGIHDRFLRDDVFRRRMIENNRDEKVCRAWDVFADEDHTYHMSQEEYFTTGKIGGKIHQ